MAIHQREASLNTQTPDRTLKYLVAYGAPHDLGFASKSDGIVVYLWLLEYSFVPLHCINNINNNNNYSDKLTPLKKGSVLSKRFEIWDITALIGCFGENGTSKTGL